MNMILILYNLSSDAWISSLFWAGLKLSGDQTIYRLPSFILYLKSISCLDFIFVFLFNKITILDRHQCKWYKESLVWGIYFIYQIILFFFMRPHVSYAGYIKYSTLLKFSPFIQRGLFMQNVWIYQLTAFT